MDDRKWLGEPNPASQSARALWLARDEHAQLSARARELAAREGAEGVGTSSCLFCHGPQVDTELRPCGHLFHGRCIKPWLLAAMGTPCCPVCSVPIVSCVLATQLHSQVPLTNGPPGQLAKPPAALVASVGGAGGAAFGASPPGSAAPGSAPGAADGPRLSNSGSREDADEDSPEDDEGNDSNGSENLHDDDQSDHAEADDRCGGGAAAAAKIGALAVGVAAARGIAAEAELSPSAQAAC